MASASTDGDTHATNVGVRQPATALQQPQNAHTHTHTNLHTSKHARTTRQAGNARISPPATTTTYTTGWHTYEARPVQQTAQPPLVTYSCGVDVRGNGDGVQGRRHPCNKRRCQAASRRPTATTERKHAHTPTCTQANTHAQHARPETHAYPHPRPPPPITTGWHTYEARPVQQTAQPPLVTYVLWSGRSWGWRRRPGTATPMQQTSVSGSQPPPYSNHRTQTRTHTNLHTSKHARTTRQAGNARISPPATTTTYTTGWHTYEARPVQQTAQPPLVTYSLWSGRRGDGDGVQGRRHPCNKRRCQAASRRPTATTERKHAHTPTCTQANTHAQYTRPETHAYPHPRPPPPIPRDGTRMRQGRYSKQRNHRW